MQGDIRSGSSDTFLTTYDKWGIGDSILFIILFMGLQNSENASIIFGAMPQRQLTITDPTLPIQCISDIEDHYFASCRGHMDPHLPQPSLTGSCAWLTVFESSIHLYVICVVNLVKGYKFGLGLFLDQENKFSQTMKPVYGKLGFMHQFAKAQNGRFWSFVFSVQNQ